MTKRTAILDKERSPLAPSRWLGAFLRAAMCLGAFIPILPIAHRIMPSITPASEILLSSWWWIVAGTLVTITFLDVWRKIEDRGRFKRISRSNEERKAAELLRGTQPQQSSRRKPEPRERHLETLGLGRDATVAEIKTAWRSVARIQHPDRSPSDPRAREIFQAAKEAYEKLVKN